MAIISNWWVLEVSTILVGVITVLYVYFKIVFQYWKKRNVYYLQPSFPFGNLNELLLRKKSYGVLLSDIYMRTQGHKMVGIFQFNHPSLVLRDPDVIKNCIVKDFDHFHDRGLFPDEMNDPLSAHLFSMGGKKWRNLRAKLTPTFTSGKMKMMFPTILECGEELAECIQMQSVQDEPIDIKETIARYSTDVIASCAFGIQCNCLKNPDAEFRLMGRKFFHQGFIHVIGKLLSAFAPSIGAKLKLGGTPKIVTEFFMKVVRDTVEHREKNDVRRNDLMHLMIQLKNQGFVEDDMLGHGEQAKHDHHSNNEQGKMNKLKMNELAAQAFLFFIAGFETSSSTVSYCLNELALNPDIQTRLRSEINKVLAKHDRQVTYEAMQEMEYLDMVISETLRKYPTVPMIIRTCTKPYTMPDTGLKVELGTGMIISVLGLHHDPEYYPEPQKFNPERFTPEQKVKRNHYCYLPFGEGPRNCIGMRFGLMQTKVALISLLTRFEFQVSKKTVTPLTFDTKSIVLSAKEGIYLHAVVK